jgi:hypothetical protein
VEKRAVEVTVVRLGASVGTRGDAGLCDA